MKGHKILLILLLVLLTTIMWCCTKEIQNEYVDNLTKEFLNFKKGSSWLYQEDSLHITQYLYVDQYTTLMESFQIDSYNYMDETIEISFKSTDSSACYQSLNPFYFGIDESYSHKYETYCSENNYNGFVFNLDSLKDLTVLGVTYKNVRHILFSGNNEYWIAKNKWIIKKIIRTPTGNWYWSLKECNIVQ